MVLDPSRYQDHRTWKMTPGLIRARQPYFRNNMIGLAILAGVSAGIYTYTYSFLHKDNDFADVPIPPINEKELEQLKREYEQHKRERQ